MYNYEYIGPTDQISTKRGTTVATGFNRIVLGERGAYVEFTDDQILDSALCLPEDQIWRILGPKSIEAYYAWYETVDNVKIYLQKKRVSYADYVPGRWYISPRDLQNFIRKEN